MYQVGLFFAVLRFFIFKLMKIKLIIAEMQMTSPLWQRRTKETLDEGERGGLKTQHSKNEDLGIWSHHFMANRWGNNGNSDRLSWAPKSLQMVTGAMKLKDTWSLKEKL